MLERCRVIGKVVGPGNHGPDYTQSRDKSGRKNLIWTVAPQVKTVEQPVQFLDAQYDGFVSDVGAVYATSSLGCKANSHGKSASC
ncbi:hypothetical protein D3C85_1391320 [compost metagenome]